MKLFRILFLSVLLCSFSACGSALIYQNWQEDLKNKTELNPLLLLLGGGGSAPSAPLVVEPISWMVLSDSSITFPRGGTGSFSIATDYPLSSCPDDAVSFSVIQSGVPINFTSGSTEIWQDGCPLGFNYTYNYDVTGSTSGTGSIIVQIPSFYFYMPSFPDMQPNQIVGVVNVTVSP